MKESTLTGINYEQSLVIIRGLPGSGKSPLARKLNLHRQYIHVEADMWWHRNEARTYDFNRELLPHAHRWSKQTVESFLAVGHDVIVSNTNLTFKEAQDYVHFAKLLYLNIVVYTMDLDVNYGSVHGVPEDVLKAMRGRMESHETFMEKVRAYQPARTEEVC